MRNCDFYQYGKAEKMHRKYKEVLADYAVKHPNDKFIHNEPTMAEWLYKEADTALQFDRGQILQMTKKDSQGNLTFCYVVAKEFLRGTYLSAPGNNNFFTFEKAMFVNADKSEFVVGSLENHIYPADTTLVDIGEEFRFKMPDIPEDVVAIVRSQLLANCPLKTATCG